MFEGVDAIKGSSSRHARHWCTRAGVGVGVVDGTADFPVDVGQYRLTMEPPGAEPIIDVGNYVVVLKRQPDGVFRLCVRHFQQ